MASVFSARSRVARIAQYAVGFASATSALGFVSYLVATKGQTFQEFNDATDPLSQSKIAKAFNPHGNSTLSDIYIARVPFERIDASLMQDGSLADSRLVERYAAGLFGGWAYAMQRRISASKAVKDVGTDPKQLYFPAQMNQSSFDEGVSVCDELVVIEKTPTSILFRGGSPPDRQGLKEVDVLLQGLAEIDIENREVVFRLKCMFYSGQKPGASPPLPEFMMPLHLMYARALAANGVANCTR